MVWAPIFRILQSYSPWIMIVGCQALMMFLTLILACNGQLPVASLPAISLTIMEPYPILVILCPVPTVCSQSCPEG